VLEAIEADVLHPDVIEPALAEALDLVRHPAVVAPAQAAALTDELRQIEAELANLLKTAKAVGPLPALVAEMHAAEQRRAGIQRALKPTPSIPTTDAATVRALLADWRTLFQAPRTSPSPGRCSGNSSPSGPPGRRRSTARSASTTSERPVRSVRLGVRCATNGGDPGGIRTRGLNLERVASWARLDDGVSGQQYTTRSSPPGAGVRGS
jgi:hypothetical protein